MIYRWVNKFRTHGTVQTSIGKTLTDNHTLDDQNHQGHHTTFLLSVTLLSTAQASLCIGEVRSLESTGSSCGIFFRADLQQIKQKLTPDDMRKRVIMCQWFCDKIDAVPDFFGNVWFSDEAHFLLSGHMNSKNNIFWGSTPPEHCLKRPVHSVKCTAWVQTWHHWAILIRVRQRTVCDNQHRPICPGAWQVLDSTWSTERDRQGPPVVPAGWCHPPKLQTNHWHGYSSVSLTD